MTMDCPICGEGEIEAEITYSHPGSPATRNHPAEGPELEWAVTKGCEACGAGDSVCHNLAYEEVEAAIVEDLNDYYAGREDEAYDEWRDDQCTRGGWDA